MLRTKEQWEKIYKDKETPWNAETAEPYLIEMVEHGILKPCSTIDLGCGTGNESIYLATKGFTVTGVDISEKAVLAARNKAKQANVGCTFVPANILDIPIKQKYDFALDRACFHFLDPNERNIYIENVSSLLNTNGTFLLIVSSDQESPKNVYQFSKEEIHKLFANHFDILSIELVTLLTHKEKPRPYICLMKKK